MSLPLPGEVAQLKMSPSSRYTDLLHFDRQKARASSVMILLHQNKEGQMCFPLIKRQEYNGIHSGQISLPGGKTESFDASMADTALRETEEELGINRQTVEIVGPLSPIFIPVSNFEVHPFVGWWHEPSPFNPDVKEVHSIVELELQYLMNQADDCKFGLQVNGHEISAPFYAAGVHKVWGATAMILCEFKELLMSGMAMRV